MGVDPNCCAPHSPFRLRLKFVGRPAKATGHRQRLCGAQTACQPCSRLTPQGATSTKKDPHRVLFPFGFLRFAPGSTPTVELLNCTDRTRFEVYGFAGRPTMVSGPLPARGERVRPPHGCIHHLDVRKPRLCLIRHEIHILIDLQGQTSRAYAHKLALRPAPVQITYQASLFSHDGHARALTTRDRRPLSDPRRVCRELLEKPIYMPDVYQVSDRKRPCAPIPTRKGFACRRKVSGFVRSLTTTTNTHPRCLLPDEHSWRVPAAYCGSCRTTLAQANLQREAEVTVL